MDITKQDILNHFALNDSSEDEEYFDEDEYDENEYDEDAYHEDDVDNYDDVDSYDEEVYDEHGDYYEDDDYHYPAQQDLEAEDKMTLILQELAELRQAVSTTSPAATTQIMPTVANSMQGNAFNPLPYMFGYGQSNIYRGNSELHIYSELARIRDDLAQAQSSHAVYVESARLKEQMRQEAKFSESQLNEEIRRLSEKLASLQKT